MLKVGITGGIGSGKSTACKVFKTLGIPVFEADSTAKKLMETDRSIREKLTALFGSSTYQPDHSLDRKYLAGIVFNNPERLKQLTDVVHPVVRDAFDQWCEMQRTPYIIYEAAILFESGFYKLLDKTISVSTDEHERIQRVMKRDGTTEEQVRQRIRNQWTDEQRIKLADFVIRNNDNELMTPQIVNIDKILKTHG